jgi:MFS family permease
VTSTGPGVVSGRLSRGTSFAAVAAIFVLFMAASGVPSPLYVVYQQEWGFSDTTLTVVFAIYIVGLLGALLTVGALSDHIGRRPVLAAAIALELVALVLFITAGDVTVLLIALGGSGEHAGRDAEAFGSWDDPGGRPPADVPLPPDLNL